MARGKYLSLEEARKLDKLGQFAKEHPSEGDAELWSYGHSQNNRESLRGGSGPHTALHRTGYRRPALRPPTSAITQPSIFSPVCNQPRRKGGRGAMPPFYAPEVGSPLHGLQPAS